MYPRLLVAEGMGTSYGRYNFSFCFVYFFIYQCLAPCLLFNIFTELSQQSKFFNDMTISFFTLNTFYSFLELVQRTLTLY